jgi:hypothetical protein
MGPAAAEMRAELPAALEQHLDRGVRLRLAHEQAGEALPRLDLLRQRVRRLAEHRDRAVFAALAQRGVRDRAVAVPGVELLAGRGEERCEALVDLDAVRLDREDLAVEVDRAAPLAASSRPIGLLEDHFTVESRVREVHSPLLSGSLRIDRLPLARVTPIRTASPDGLARLVAARRPTLESASLLVLRQNVSNAPQSRLREGLARNGRTDGTATALVPSKR